MSQTRREFISISSKLLLASAAYGIGAVASPLQSGHRQAGHSQSEGQQALAMHRGQIRAIAFDAFPIFDPRPIFALAGRLFPKQGKRFSVLWRTRIFEYTWLRASAGQYRDFWACIEDALIYTALELQVDLSVDKKQQLMQAFLDIRAFPDVKPALQSFKKAGIKLVFLSNMTESMLSSGIKNAGLDGYFDDILSTDRVKTFKPDRKAYQLAPDSLNLPKEEIAFAAFASWDAAGAKWFGFPTVWVNRLKFKPEVLNAQPDAVGEGMDVLSRFVLSERS